MNDGNLSMTDDDALHHKALHHNHHDSENSWATLPSPMTDIFLEHVIPSFLGVTDFIALSAVCQRYRQVFGRPIPLAAGGTAVNETTTTEETTAAETTSAATATASPPLVHSKKRIKSDNNNNNNNESIMMENTNNDRINNNNNHSDRINNSSNTTGGGCFLFDKILATLLRREAEVKIKRPSAVLGCRNQLPTLGNDVSPEQSLTRNALGVAKLRRAALRRRRLVRLEWNRGDGGTTTNDEGHYHQSCQEHGNDNVDATFHQHLLQQLLRQEFRPLAPPTIRAQRQRHQLPVRDDSCGTTFICINHTPWPIYCHWVNGDGELQVREGDLIQGYDYNENEHENDESLDGENNGNHGQHEQQQEHEDKRHRQRRPTTHSFELRLSRSSRRVLQATPPHVFMHMSSASHSFGLCWTEGGGMMTMMDNTTDGIGVGEAQTPTCFAIYQQRRCWDKILGNSGHAHAIVISCDTTEQDRQQDNYPASQTEHGNNNNNNNNNKQDNTPIHHRKVDVQEVHFSTYSQRGPLGSLVLLHGQVDRETGQLLHHIDRQAEHPPPQQQARARIQQPPPQGRGAGMGLLPRLQPAQPQQPPRPAAQQQNRPCMVDDTGLIQLEHSLTVTATNRSDTTSIGHQDTDDDDSEQESQSLRLARRFYGTHIPLLEPRGGGSGIVGHNDDDNNESSRNGNRIAPQWKQGPAAIARMLLRGQEQRLTEESALAHGLTRAFYTRICNLSNFTRTHRQQPRQQERRQQESETHADLSNGDDSSNQNEETPLTVLVASPLDFPNPLGEALWTCYDDDDDNRKQGI